MVTTCCAYGCKERYIAGGPITFHSFPKDEFRRKQWFINLRRDNFKVSDYSKICSKHFTTQSFDTTKFGGTWLKKDAVPTLFDLPPQLQIKQEPREPSPESVPANIVVREKRKIYIGDFTHKDMDCPSKAQLFMEVAKKHYSESTKTIQGLKRKNKRLDKRISSLREKLEALKKTNLFLQCQNNKLQQPTENGS